MKKFSENLTFPALWKKSVAKYGSLPFLSFVGKKALSFTDVDNRIQSLIACLEKNGLQQGDKIAILSANMPNWGISYLAVTTMGAVVVPILPDFHPKEIANILDHSGVKALFVSENLMSKVEKYQSKKLRLFFKIDDFSILKTEKELSGLIESERPQNNYVVDETDMAAIIYTSGTTGTSKGVMLSHQNICCNAFQGKGIQKVDSSDRFLSILPLSHTLENTVGFVIPMLSGSSIFYIKKVPTPSVLLSALKIVRPTFMLSVPLIIEKIYRNKIKPTIQKSAVLRNAVKIPFLRKKVARLSGKKLLKSFGGELKFFGIGGAKLDKEVEKFLKEAKFPYAIGYGLTETSPLLAGSNNQNTVLESTGRAVEGVELNIHDPNPKTREGEIWARGDNIMLGYYKEPKLTSEVLTKDGWFKTGDLGILDKSDYLYIKGRIKNMIVGPSGENIYPEEIESVINNFRHVVESLVIEKKGKLVAMVHFNYEELEKRFQSLKGEVNEAKAQVDTHVDDLIVELNTYVNSQLNKFSQVSQFVVQPIPFERTPTKKIKRFLYI